MDCRLVPALSCGDFATLGVTGGVSHHPEDAPEVSNSPPPPRDAPCQERKFEKKKGVSQKQSLIKRLGLCLCGTEKTK